MLNTYTIGEYKKQPISSIQVSPLTLNLLGMIIIKVTTKKAYAQCHQGLPTLQYISKVKLNCNKSLVRPILEYASIVWAPYTAANITSIEKVQRYSVRFICNDYSRLSSVTEMLQTLSLPTLNQCRDTAKTVFMYKILHQIVDVSAT